MSDQIEIYEGVPTALVVIDLQKGLRRLLGTLQPRSFDEVLARNEQLAGEFTKAGAQVAIVTVTAPGLKGKLLNALLGFAKPLFSQEVLQRANVTEWVKTSPDVFATTNLADFLQSQSITKVTLTGVVTNNGVLNSAKGALKAGLEVEVIENACAARTSEQHDQALKELQEIGVEVKVT